MSKTKKKILILDNDPLMLFLLAGVFTDAGYAVDCRRTGAFILESKYKLPDLFIIERDLPTIDGIAISKFLRIHGSSKDVPIIMLSAYELQDRASQLGLEGFVRKPFELSHFMKLVERCMAPGYRAGYSPVHR